MNERIKELAEQSGVYFGKAHKDYFGEEHLAYISTTDIDVAKFAELIVRECINKIETYRIPVGNSAVGEMACEWTYDALKEIRDEIKEHFGVE